ncbi:MAG TPA: aromatic ring-hydroxylating dioxygenase subunit alpha [Roseiarcus sp.]|nr:aromatic ring-hydroxylating dioxygenase subunit alpha [Roseiarcus sp.]
MDEKYEMRTDLRARRKGHALPRKLYLDPDYYRLDLENIWYRQWLFAGHDCEIPKPGDFFTLQVGDYPVIVVRGRDGAIRAFHNTCRHRGSRICSAERGSSARLVCPYHNWSYELDGRLLFARDMGSDFDRGRHGLKAAHCESVSGYIFICLAEAAPDLSAFRALIEPYVAPHALASAKLAAESTIIEEANWKLVWENNRECYHCTPNHPELCRTFPEAPTISGVDGAMNDPLIADHWRRCEAIGLPSRFEISADGQYRATRMPLLRDAVSYTLSGKAAVAKPLSDAIAEPNIGTLLLFHYPSIWNHLLGDHAVTFRVLPLGPTRTQVTTKWLVHCDALEGVDYSVEELTHVWKATNDQDRRIVEENQRGVSSPAFEPGPYSAFHEGGVMQFVEWYCQVSDDALAARPFSPLREEKVARSAG